MRRILLGTAAVLTAAGLVGFGMNTASAQEAPIRIGLLMPYSAGPFTAIGTEMTDAFMLALEDANNQIGGRKIEVLKEDTTHKPDVAQAKAKKLVFEDKVDMLIGPVSSQELTALSDFAKQSRTPLIIPNAGDNEATGDRCSPWILRTSFSNDQISRDMGKWLVGRNLKRVYVLMLDNKAGQQVAAGFKRGLQAAGGTVVGEQYTPVGATFDFGPVLTRVREAKPDAVYAFYAGSLANVFVKQFTDFGLKQDKIALTGPGWLVSPLNLPAQGEAAAGALAELNYVPAIDNPANKAFQQTFQAKYNRVASEFAAQAFDTGKLILAALQQTGGRTTDKRAIVQALHSASIEGTRGPLRIDPKTNNVIQTMYFFEVRKTGDKLDYTVLSTVPAVQDPPNGCKL
jgi:branched-chain amino acid transport system substrate-binding protein